MNSVGIRSFLLNYFAIALVAVNGLWAADTRAEEQGVPDYAYSVFVGTGVYKIEDRTIYVLRAPMYFDLKKPDPENNRKWGIRLLLPVAVGVTKFDDFFDLPDFGVDDIQSISVVPGIEIPIVINPEFTVSPFFQVGLGVDAKSESRSVIWGSGVRLRLEPETAPNWLFGGEFLWAGNNPNNNQPTTDFTRWGFGTEYRIDTGWTLFDRDLSVHLRALRWRFSDAVRFEPPVKLTKLNAATEVGISVSFSRPFNIFGYKFYQGGVGYEWSNDFEAIKFFTTFPF